MDPNSISLFLNFINLEFITSYLTQPFQIFFVFLWEFNTYQNNFIGSHNFFSFQV